MLELLIEIAPGLRRVAILFNPDTAPGGGAYYLSGFEAAAQSSKMEPITARARSDAEIETVVASLGKEPNSGLVVMPDFFMFNHVQPIILLAARNNVPTIYPWRFVVAKNGALLSYGPDLRDIVRRGAPYVDQIFRGAKPADLPVQVPVKFEMAVNVKTAKALGLVVPPSMLLRADEVIEYDTFLLHRMSPLLAQSGHPYLHRTSPYAVPWRGTLAPALRLGVALSVRFASSAP
jgi:ABC-type uncharacterized transport system substrate-binding protein